MLYFAFSRGSVQDAPRVAQGVQLFSADSSNFVVAQPDGNLVLYNANLYNNVYGATPAAAIWYSGTGGATNAPFTVIMQEVCTAIPPVDRFPQFCFRVQQPIGHLQAQGFTLPLMMQDCNLVLYNSEYLQYGPSSSYAWWASNTYYGGAPLCNLTVLGGAAGSLQITDSVGKLVWTTAGRASPEEDTIAQGHSLAQGARLYSANGQYFLTLQSDDNLVICKLSATSSCQSTGCFAGRCWLVTSVPHAWQTPQPAIMHMARPQRLLSTFLVPMKSLPTRLSVCKSCRSGEYQLQAGMCGLRLSAQDGVPLTQVLAGSEVMHADQKYLMQGCNVVMKSASGTVLYNFNNANKGTSPCRLQMLNTGQAAIVDSMNVVWSLDAQPAGPTSNGTLLAGQTIAQACPASLLAAGSVWAGQVGRGSGAALTSGLPVWLQGSTLYSSDLKVFLAPQPTGALLLLNTSAYNTYGIGPASIIWQSQTSSTAAPFYLVMQEARHLSRHVTGGHCSEAAPRC